MGVAGSSGGGIGGGCECGSWGAEGRREEKKKEGGGEETDQGAGNGAKRTADGHGQGE